MVASSSKGNVVSCQKLSPIGSFCGLAFPWHGPESDKSAGVINVVTVPCACLSIVHNEADTSTTIPVDINQIESKYTCI